MTNVFKSRDGKIFDNETSCAAHELALDALDLCCRIDREVNPFTGHVMSEERIYSTSIIAQNAAKIAELMGRIVALQS
jgi:hypothetical protein